MKNYLYKLGYILMTMPMFCQAVCIKVIDNSQLSSEVINQGYSASSWTGACNANICTGKSELPGVISISSSDNFMPSGTLLASSISSFLTAGATKPYSQNQILFRCDIQDADAISEIYGTNSTYAFTGAQEVEDIEKGYFTYLNGIALRYTNMETGKYYSANWQSRKIEKSSYIESGGYIFIPASAFSSVQTEVFKTTARNYTGPSISSNRYFYDQQITQGLIAFRGPGLATNLIKDGSYVGTNHPGWYDLYPGGFSLYGITFIKGSTCNIKDYPSKVILPKTSVSELIKGQFSQQRFSISLQCEDSAQSGVTSNGANVAMGFLVNQENAVAKAKNLGLTSGEGLTHLLDTNYGDTGVASGVGIRIYDEGGNALNLLSSRMTGTRNPGGWYGYKDITYKQGDTVDGISTYTGVFTASLEALSGQTVTSGSLNSQLQIVVSFQ